MTCAFLQPLQRLEETGVPAPGFVFVVKSGKGSGSVGGNPALFFAVMNYYELLEWGQRRTLH
jgi:hypothetical protein